MQIENSAVSLTAKRSYYARGEVKTTKSYLPCIEARGIVITKKESPSASAGGTEGALSSFNYGLGKNGQVGEIETGTSVMTDTNTKIRISTLNYLLKILFGETFGGKTNEISDAFNQLFESSRKYFVTATSSYSFEESQGVDFSSEGTVKTADGRELSFNYSFTMSSSFKEEYQESASWTEEISLTDPLVINLDSNPDKISDQKFYFDLDCDGKEDEISTLGEQKGFLSLDKNNDGIINDGSELFGTKSGNGFKDLSEYDEDGNGWIDEGDTIFSRLRIWCVSNDGSSELIRLKEADVGAIYLGNVSTDYNCYDDEKNTLGVIRQSGIFLHESTGAAGTITHIDLAR